jgi:hypothetical protein
VLLGDVLELPLGEDRQVGSFRKILPRQAADVFTDCPLPPRVRVGEEDLGAGPLGEHRVLSHLGSLIVGHEAAHLAVDALEDLCEVLGGGLRIAGFEFHEGQEKGRALDRAAS